MPPISFLSSWWNQLAPEVGLEPTARYYRLGRQAIYKILRRGRLDRTRYKVFYFVLSECIIVVTVRIRKSI